MAQITRTYHDVTKLEKSIALSKVKDVMDISSGTEFFTVLKDPTSVIPQVNDTVQLKYENNTNYSYYFKPGKTYSFSVQPSYHVSLAGVDSSNYFAANIKITKLEYDDGSMVIAPAYEGQIWTTTPTMIKNDARSVTLVREATDGNNYRWVFYFTNRYIGTRNISTSTPSANIVSNYHYYIPADNIRNLEFKVYDGVYGRFNSADSNIIFNYFKRSLTVDDYSEVLYLTQKIPNHYSFHVHGLKYDALSDFAAVLNGISSYNYKYMSEATALAFLRTIDNGIDSLAETAEGYDYPHQGIIEIKDSISELIKSYNDGYFTNLALRGEDFILFNDLNSPAAGFIKVVFKTLGLADDVSIHPHTSKKLFNNISVKSITHPADSGDLYIGDPRNSGLPNSGCVRFVEDVSLNSNNIKDVGSLTGQSLTSNTGTITTLSGNSATFTNITTTNMTVNSVISANSIGINKNRIETVGPSGTVHGMSLVVFDYDKDPDHDNAPVIVTEGGRQYAKGTLRQTALAEAFDTSTNIAQIGRTYYESHKFLGIDGKFYALTPTFLGLSADDHGHGEISSDGCVTTKKEKTVGSDQHVLKVETADRIVIADGGSSNPGKIKAGPAFHATSDANIVDDSSTEYDRKYLSEAGYWKTAGSMLFRSVLNTNDKINAATALGIHKIAFGSGSGYTFPNSTGGAGIPRTDAYGSAGTDGLHYDSISASGILLVLPNNSTNSTSEADASIMQIAYTNELQANNTTVKPQVFVRNGVKDGNGITWKKWVALAHTDHDHNKEYARVNIAGTKVAGNVTIFGSGQASSAATFYDSSFVNANNNSYKIEFVDNGSGSTDTVNNILSSHDNYGKFTWTATDTLMELSHAASGNLLQLTSSTKLHVGGTSTFNQPISLATNGTNPAAAEMLSNNSNIASTKVLILSEASNNLRTVKYANVTAQELYQLSGINTNETIQTQLNKFTAHVSTSNVISAHGSLNSDGTVAAPASTITIGSGDTLLIAEKTNGKLEKGIAFGTNTAQFLANSGAWTGLPGVWSVTTSNSTTTASKTDGTITNGGLISKTDIENLHKMWSVWELDNNADTKINKIQEVLKAFENLDENTDLYNKFTAMDTAIGEKLPLAGGTMTGVITAYTGATHRGILLGNAYLNAINGNVIFQNVSEIRFGGDTWAYSDWAGLKYNNTDKIVSLGIADASVFTSNTTGKNGGTLQLPGISTLKLYGTGNNNGHIYFNGTKSTDSMIRFINNDTNAYGNGISIGGGGRTIVGAGEAATLYQGTVTDENLYLVADGSIYIKTNCNDGDSTSKTITIGTDGNVSLTGNISTSGIVYSESNKVVTTVSTAGTGLSGGVTAANSTGTITLDSSAEGNRTANKVVIAKANGQINSEKFTVTSGATAKATMQYNSTDDCIDFIFA